MKGLYKYVAEDRWNSWILARLNTLCFKNIRSLAQSSRKKLTDAGIFLAGLDKKYTACLDDLYSSFVYSVVSINDGYFRCSYFFNILPYKYNIICG